MAGKLSLAAKGGLGVAVLTPIGYLLQRHSHLGLSGNEFLIVVVFLGVVGMVCVFLDHRLKMERQRQQHCAETMGADRDHRLEVMRAAQAHCETMARLEERERLDIAVIEGKLTAEQAQALHLSHAVQDAIMAKRSGFVKEMRLLREAPADHLQPSRLRPRLARGRDDAG
ncbi:hypothetical protein [Bailinhaonella thermotolerans]|uniref:Uncharacterized protein n=1 Tax=Bailinhaonella thermotolerans TaxID=1070861 RepID=A0A3A4AS49_9ACTN|nr:hypothetical protein [Bailinhaonella thermotolerans]RJL32708.1 hypothetical protein D5H75_14560 [Bailinhaonella thermotolerans]